MFSCKLLSCSKTRTASDISSACLWPICKFKLPVVVIQKFCNLGKVRSHFSGISSLSESLEAVFHPLPPPPPHPSKKSYIKLISSILIRSRCLHPFVFHQRVWQVQQQKDSPISSCKQLMYLIHQQFISVELSIVVVMYSALPFLFILKVNLENKSTSSSQTFL